ncbi:TIGR02217 family protein [Sulfitobacter marinus]|uniref:TIGR02217 family protein n=1 Tax=Sulfitobacter marinus TaxID=394264 RepID=A0A1I6Q634_9RHOB|nr:DUF2460 domain-containing protein [Sulfitobacter marinus]SFS47874.1 TIGR02217 family protein [Sulfitobacter marinus]
MNFHDVQFPPSLSFGSVGGPQRRTDVVTLANGFEERNTPWSHSRRVYDAGLGMRSIDDLQALTGFFEARFGQMYGFRWKDWSDFKSCRSALEVAFDDQVLGFGDGVQTDFQLVKIYESGDHSYLRPIAKPVQGTVRVGIEQDELQEGIDYEIDTTTGIVRFDNAPGSELVVSAGFEFDVPVRFDTDRILVSVASFQAGQVPNVPVIEVRG